MSWIVGADPDRLEAAARQVAEASSRLENASAQLGGLIAQAKDVGSPATAYAEMALVLTTLSNHVAAAHSAAKALNTRALQQREQSGGSQDGRGSIGSSPAPRFTAEEQQLIERVESDRDWLRQTAERLRANGDGNFWFAQTYYHVTDELLKSVKDGRYGRPATVLLEEIGFTQVYRQNLAAWESGNYQAVYPNWAVAFERVRAINEGDWSKFESHLRTSMVGPSALAHIKWDLADRVAAVARRIYGDDITDAELATVRSDFFKMADIFPKAEKAMRAEIVNGTVLFDPGRSQVLQDLLKGVFFPTDQVRWEAFNTAVGIIEAHRVGIHDSAGIERFLYDRGVLPRRISTQVIRGYPWQ